VPNTAGEMSQILHGILPARDNVLRVPQENFPEAKAGSTKFSLVS